MPAAASSPTLTTPAATLAGVILGTAAYMSPEQAAGKPVDRRSDLWAFGVVVFEMLTGRPVFTGEDVSHVLASVLKSEPDWTALPASTPTPVRRLLRRCLEKDRKRRLADAADARLEIEVAAHRQGVIHRDLKPGNVMVTRTGTKLLDFGLAKTASPAVGHRFSGAGAADGTPKGAPYNRTAANGTPGGAPYNPTANLTSPPTMTTPLTAAGTIFGTFQYMSPEQVQGAEADARSDIFAFGALVYEMVTGTKAFSGKNEFTVIGAILDHDPAPLSQFETAAPATLNRLVKKCLAKDPESRWQTARDLASELEWIAESVSHPAAETTPTVVATPQPAKMRRARFLTTAIEAGKLRTEPLLQTAFIERNGEVSPDGHWLAYESNESGDFQVYVRPFPNVNGGRWQVSPKGGTKPLWASNGRELFYFADGFLTTVPVQTSSTFSSGNPTKVFDTRYFAGNAERTYDVSRDGQKFLMVKDAQAGVQTQTSTTSTPTQAPASMIVVLNWFEELKTRVPMK